MRFNVQALRDAVVSALAADREKYDRTVENDTRAEERALQRWFEKYEAAWVDSSRQIADALHSGVPVTLAMLPQSTHAYHRVATFEPPKQDAPIEYRAPADLLQFAAVLDAITDDEVSASGLKDLGFINLRKIAPFMQPKGR